MWNSDSSIKRYLAKWPVVVIWLSAWQLMQAMDGHSGLANLALILVLASAVCGLWLSAVESVVVCAFAVMAFNFHFVPPRGTFSVDLRQHAWLLLVMLGVGSMVAWLMGRQRLLTESARITAEHANLLRAFSEQLPLVPPDSVLQALALQLQTLTGAEVIIGSTSLDNDSPALQVAWGQANAEDLANLQECLRTASPGSFALADVHGYQALTLPLRGQKQCPAAALLRTPAGHPLSPAVHATAQALCDQTGLHLERTFAEESTRQAREEAKTQKLRNTLLAAISHDYRTPLATMLGAATSLISQADRLSREQARALATTIVEEVERLSTLTDNTLQLARLDAAGVQITKDWESLEELVGAAVGRTRTRYPQVRVSLRIEPLLPLLRCDAQLLIQLLDNLIDNAVKYGGPLQTVEIIARKLDDHLLLSVADRGPGIPVKVRERMFLMFERGAANGISADGSTPRGTGLGLALCRAIVLAHGGSLTAKQRQRGGTSMDCLFPLEPQPLAMEPR
jgi:two-component system sensor histidine kinase KdpD